MTTTHALPLKLYDVATHISSRLAMPAHLIQILRMLDSQFINLETVAHEIECEPAVVAKLMRIANSPFYGVSGQVDSISHALRIIGTSNTQSFVTATIAMAQLQQLDTDAETFSVMQHHSLSVAYLARHLARATGLSQDTAFVAGLLHDFGRYVLLTEYPDQYAPALALAHEKHVSISEAEQKTLGFNHADVGAEIARIWRYPPRISDAIRDHHAPAEQIAGLTLLVALANRLDNDDERCTTLQVMAWERLGIQQAMLDDAIQQTELELRLLGAPSTDEHGDA